MNEALMGLSVFLKSMADIPEEELSAFYQKLSVRSLDKGEFFCRAGEPNDTLAFVAKGLFRVYYTAGDKKFIRNFCPEGTPIASYATLLTAQPAHVNIEALEDSVVAEMKYTDFISFYKRHVSWEKFGRKVAENFYVKREQREYQLLTMDAQSRYEIFQQEFGSLADRLTQVNIAGYLGISPESLSRILKKS